MADSLQAAAHDLLAGALGASSALALRLVRVTNYVLYAAKIHGKGLGDAKGLHDFNDMAFEANAAPY